MNIYRDSIKGPPSRSILHHDEGAWVREEALWSKVQFGGQMIIFVDKIITFEPWMRDTYKTRLLR